MVNLALWPLNSVASDIELGAGPSLYSDQMEPSYHYKFSYKRDSWPVYGVLQYEEPTIRMRGQPLGDSQLLTVGLGARKYWGNFFVMGEFGFTIVEEGARERIQREVTYTELVDRHNVTGRPVPFDRKGYETLWELDHGFSGAVGIGWVLWEHVVLTASYRALYVDEHIEVWDPVRREEKGQWWQESRSRDLSAFQGTVTYKW